MELENIVGNLRDAYKKVEPGTLLHSDELQAARVTDPSLRNVGFYPADGNIYHLKEGVPHLAITREGDNPVLRHIDNAFTQLIKTGNYRPSAKDVVSALASETTLDIDLTTLRLQGDNAEWKYLLINPKSYDGFNPEEEKLAERVHGSGPAFAATMKMLADARIKETRIYVLSPDYVRKHATEAAIERASWLNNISGNSYFVAGDRNININDRLRGVRRRASVSEQFAPEGRVAQGVDYLAIYQTILANPEQARAALNDEIASGLQEILSRYYNK